MESKSQEILQKIKSKAIHNNIAIENNLLEDGCEEEQSKNNCGYGIETQSLTESKNQEIIPEKISVTYQRSILMENHHQIDEGQKEQVEHNYFIGRGTESDKKYKNQETIPENKSATVPIKNHHLKDGFQDEQAVNSNSKGNKTKLNKMSKKESYKNTHTTNTTSNSIDQSVTESTEDGKNGVIAATEFEERKLSKEEDQRTEFDHVFWDKFVLEANQIHEIFSAASNSILTPDNVNVFDLMMHHQRKAPLKISTLLSLTARQSKLINHFATNLPKFNKLSKHDQVILLRDNIPLYVQYILARYFHAPDGMNQVLWLVAGQLSQPPSTITEKLTRLTFEEYNNSVHFIPKSDNAQSYLNHSNNIEWFFPFSPSLNGLIANMILFYPANHTDLQNPEMVSTFYNEAAGLVQKALRYFNMTRSIFQSMDPFFNSLTKMKEESDN